MISLTDREIEAGLWCVGVVKKGYGKEPPEGSVIESFQRKLLAELESLGGTADMSAEAQ